MSTVLQQDSFQDATVSQRPIRPVVVHAAHAITPLGEDLAQTAAAVRANISRFNNTSFYDQRPESIRMALVPDEALPPLDSELDKQQVLTTRQVRLLRLATEPLQKLYHANKSKLPFPLFLAGPEKLPGRRSIISDKFLGLIAAQTKVPLDLENSYVFPFGRAAGLYALESAMSFLEANPGRQVIVGGVDSYVDPYLLGTLARDERIASAGTMDGFVPGEAAAFLLIGDQAQSQATKGSFILHPPGIAEEPGHQYSDQPYKGAGLSMAVAQAMNINPKHHVNTIFISLNGENYYAKEWGVAAIRNKKEFADTPNLLHPADCFGDIGAAFAPMSIGIAITGIHHGYLKSPAAICCSSELQYRAAVCLTHV